MLKRDPKGYYAALGISPEATASEIRLSYKFIKQSYKEEGRQVNIRQVQAAYEVLSDPKARRAYDRGDAGGGGNFAWVKSISLRQVLVPILIISAMVLLVLVGPSLRAQLRSFDPGDQVVWAENEEPVGKVLSFEREHRFSSGTVAPAFEILPASGGEPIWYPARDLKRYGRTR